MKRLIILGAGGYGQVVADVARQSGRYEAVCFLDDTKSGREVLGSLSAFIDFVSADVEMIPAFGDNEGRLAWIERLASAGMPVATLIHAAAYVSPGARIEPGTVVLPRAVVNTGCHVKRGCIINCGAIVDHDCELEEGVHVCLGAIVKGENRVPRCTKVEAGAIIQNRTYPL